MNKNTMGLLSFVGLVISACGMIVLGIFFPPFSENSAHWSLIVFGALLAVFVACLVTVFIQRKNGSFGAGGTDPLTGLGDKHYLQTGYQNATAVPGLYVCLGYIGTDAVRLRSRCGNESVDELFKTAAKYLFSSCELNECVARVDDGVFAFCLCSADGLQAEKRFGDMTAKLNQLSQKLLRRDVSPFHTGIRIPNKTKADFATVFTHAKLAYEQAAESKVPTYICTDELVMKEDARSRLRTRLSHAIDNKQFEMFLQFVYNVKGDAFAGAEVLSRWNNPEEGLLMPAYYINDMRNTGVIGKFDVYMLDKTCDLLQKWKGTEFDGVLLSCNITYTSLTSPDFFRKFKETVKKYDFDRKHLILEITEEALINKESVAYKNVSACREMGVQIALDDFGRESLFVGDLDDCPVNQVKVDRQVILKAENEKGQHMLSGLINKAHQSGLEVVCEGVETEQQKETAIGNGCDYVQGYYYSYVFPVDEGKAHYLESLHHVS